MEHTTLDYFLIRHLMFLNWVCRKLKKVEPSKSVYKLIIQAGKCTYFGFPGCFMVLHICTSVVGCSCIEQLNRTEMTLYCTSITMQTFFNCKVFLVCHFQVATAQCFFCFFLIQRSNFFLFFKPHYISEQSTKY